MNLTPTDGGWQPTRDGWSEFYPDDDHSLMVAPWIGDDTWHVLVHVRPTAHAHAECIGSEVDIPGLARAQRMAEHLLVDHLSLFSPVPA